MTSYEADLDDITRTIWGTLFEHAIERSDAAPVGVESTVTSIVHIDGAWQGAVMLRCPPSTISLPAVVFGSDYELDVPNTTVVACVPFVCDEQPVVVMLVQRSAANLGVAR